MKTDKPNDRKVWVTSWGSLKSLLYVAVDLKRKHKMWREVEDTKVETLETKTEYIRFLKRIVKSP